MDPGVVAGEAGGPDHGVDVEVAVLEVDGRARSAQRAAVERDPARRRADQRLAFLQALPSRESAVIRITPSASRNRKMSRPGSAAEAAAGASRRRGGPRASPRAPRRSGSRCYRRRPRGRGPRERSPAAGSRRCEVAERSTANAGTRGTWNGPVATITWSACSVRSASSTSKPGWHADHAAVVVDRQIAGVLGQVVHELVAGRVVVRVARERLAGQAVVARRCEQPQRVPARRATRRRAPTPPRGS